ncbi:unnamed protein product [Allacma fusca]|uniref:Uncharacterized protein n=1 Tax=Allacma fusca TaxID=39272 RepID=A0A8J2K6Z2_9HEXA|nr:unnamed protein product [Allacma fusca]
MPTWISPKNQMATLSEVPEEHQAKTQNKTCTARRGTSVVEFSAETPSSFFDISGENAVRNGLALHRQSTERLSPASSPN